MPESNGQSFSPYLTVRNADAAIEFYKNAFGATEVYRIGPAGSVGHAELTLGEALFMLSDEFPAIDVLGPESHGGSGVCLHFYVEDVDAFVERAVAAGAKVLRPVADQFYGDRGGKLVDPFGHLWWFATRKENLTPDEIKRRAAELFGS